MQSFAQIDGLAQGDDASFRSIAIGLRERIWLALPMEIADPIPGQRVDEALFTGRTELPDGRAGLLGVIARRQTETALRASSISFIDDSTGQLEFFDLVALAAAEPNTSIPTEVPRAKPRRRLPVQNFSSLSDEQQKLLTEAFVKHPRNLLDSMSREAYAARLYQSFPDLKFSALSYAAQVMPADLKRNPIISPAKLPLVEQARLELASAAIANLTFKTKTSHAAALQTKDPTLSYDALSNETGAHVNELKRSPIVKVPQVASSSNELSGPTPMDQ